MRTLLQNSARLEYAGTPSDAANPDSLPGLGTCNEIHHLLRTQHSLVIDVSDDIPALQTGHSRWAANA